jgi:hypothetical protein
LLGWHICGSDGRLPHRWLWGCKCHIISSIIKYNTILLHKGCIRTVSKIRRHCSNAVSCDWLCFTLWSTGRWIKLLFVWRYLKCVLRLNHNHRDTTNIRRDDRCAFSRCRSKWRSCQWSLKMFKY